MLVNKAYRFELKFNNKEETLLNKHAGTARFAYKKKFINDSFRLTGSIKVFDKNHAKYPKRVQLPRLGRMKLKEDPIKLIKKLDLGKTRILSATVTRRAHKWYVNLAVVEEIVRPNNTSISTIGVDLGLKVLAVMSDGSTVPNSKPLRTSINKLKRMQKAHSRKVKGSSNRRKSARQLAKLHLKIANKRQDPLNKLSTKLAKNHGRIVIEDLNVDGMIKNHKLAQAICDVSWGKFRTMLEHKCEWYGSELVVADRFYPSSKLCSSCGWKDNNLTLDDREFKCLQCGLKIDRDANASINLENYPVAVSSMETSNACGGASVGSPAKQES